MNALMRKNIAVIIVVQFFLVSMITPMARAVMIPTQQLVENADQHEARNQLTELLTREDVSKALIEKGVDPEIVRLRLATLTPEEIKRLNLHLEELPAGGGALEVLGVVFLVLLVLELVGITNIFHKI